MRKFFFGHEDLCLAILIPIAALMLLAVVFAGPAPVYPSPSSGGSTGANPTAAITGTVINGAASTFMRSDAAPALASGVTLVAPVLGTVASGVISACTSTSMVMVTPVLGTPTSGTLTNCTGLPANGVLGQTTNAQSGTTYTLALGDGMEIVTGSNGSATVFSIPTNASVAFPTGTQIVVIQIGAGALTISAANAGTTTITSAGASAVAPILNAQYCACVCLKTGTDTWLVFGNIK